MAARLVSIMSSSGRLQLRSPEVSDAANLVARGSDPACVEFLPHLRNRTPTLAGNTRRIEQWRASSLVKDLFLVVVTLDNGQVIGDGGFELIDTKSKVGEVGIMLNSGPSVRGKGYAVEALAAMFDYAFKTLDLETVLLRTLEINTPMRTLLEKKFNLVAESREVEFGTECVYTLLKKDWLASKMVDGKIESVVA